MSFRKWGFICGILASGFCFAGGFWLLFKTIQKSNFDDALSIGLGLYFIGKSFFVGPMLILTAAQLDKNKNVV